MIENYAEWSLYFSHLKLMGVEEFQRDYDAEDEFISNMEEIAEFWLHDAYIVRGNNPQQIGFYLALPKDISNDNALAVLP